MGQRVHIVLKVTDRKNNSKVTIYHDQWGIGRKGLLNIMSLHHAFYNKRYGKPIAETVKLNPEASGIWEEYNLIYYKGRLTEFLHGKERYDIGDAGSFRRLENVSDPESIGEFIDRFCDNNNGVVFIDVTEIASKDNVLFPDTEIKYGFLLGHEDECGTYDHGGEPEICNPENGKLGPAFSKWLSLDEWCNLGINKPYTDEEFKQICKSFFGYFGLQEMKK